MTLDEPPPTQPTTRSRIGLALSLVWLVACFVALSGKCDAPSKPVQDDALFNPKPTATPANESPAPDQSEEPD